MTDQATLELASRFPAKVASIRMRVAYNWLDINKCKLTRVSSAKGSDTIWTVSIPAREPKQLTGFGILYEAHDVVIPIDLGFRNTQPIEQLAETFAKSPAAATLDRVIKITSPEYDASSYSDFLFGFDLDWRGWRPQAFYYTLAGRRMRDRENGIEARKTAVDWRPDFQQGEQIATVDDARASLQRRRRSFGWTVLKATDAAEGTELSALGAFLRTTTLDFEVPDDFATDALCKVTVSRKILPFYKHHRLYEVFDCRHARPRRTRFLFSPDELGTKEIDRLIPLDGSADAIHELNAKSVLNMAGDDLIEYVTFFCDHVAGNRGSSFATAESPTDIAWRVHDHGNDVKSELGNLIFPLRLWPEPFEGNYETKKSYFEQIKELKSGAIAPGSWIVDGFTAYENSFFHVVYWVRPNGLIGMADDNPVMQALPARLSLMDADSHFLMKRPVR